MALTEKQQGVVRNVVPAAIVTALGLCGAPIVLPLSVLPADEAGARITWALMWTVLPALALMVSIVRVANYRFSSREDIEGRGLADATPAMRVLRAVSQNTLEQAVLASAAYVTWAAVMPYHWLRAICVAAALFVVGRVLFARGYRRGPAGRAMGFGLTAYPTFGMLAAVSAVLVFRLLGWVAER
jgi:hypothetical protein